MTASEDPTVITRDDDQFHLVALVLKLLPHLTFRHHGIGLLQAYIAEGEREECRLHVWHSRLVVPGKMESGGSHNHRFDLTSSVLVGAIHHTFLRPVSDAEGAYRMATVNPARSVLGGGKGAELSALPGSFSLEHADHVIPAGSRYAFPKRAFHRAFARGPTITLVHKSAQEPDPATVILHKDAVPMFAVSSPDPDLQMAVVRSATEALERRLAELGDAR